MSGMIHHFLTLPILSGRDFTAQSPLVLQYIPRLDQARGVYPHLNSRAVFVLLDSFPTCHVMRV